MSSQLGIFRSGLKKAISQSDDSLARVIAEFFVGSFGFYRDYLKQKQGEHPRPICFRRSTHHGIADGPYYFDTKAFMCHPKLPKCLSKLISLTHA